MADPSRASARTQPALESPPISAALACYNEAHHLEASLPRLAFCDEILVVDLGSQDRSVAIAQAHGARVLHHDWVPFREKVVQWILTQAQHDWILFCDPDLVLPEGVGPRITELLSCDSGQPLGMVYLPMVTCFGKQPLRRGQKSGRRAYRALVHRERVHLADLLHHKGVGLRDGFTAVCLRPRDRRDDILHYWVRNWGDAMAKARRYLPHEGETRHTIGQRFSWRGALREALGSLRTDLRRMAFLDWQATQVMVFQFWYIWQANLALRRYQRERADKA